MGNLVPTTFFSEVWSGRAPIQILDFPAEVTGRIREMHLWFERVVGNGAYFTVRRNQVFLLNGFGSDPLNFLQVTTGIGSGDSVVGLDIPVVRGEPIDVRRVTNQGTLTGPAEFLIVTEEGV